MILEVATNGLSWAQEFNTMSLSHMNLITAENGEDAAPHYRDHNEFPNWVLNLYHRRDYLLSVSVSEKN